MTVICLGLIAALNFFGAMSAEKAGRPFSSRIVIAVACLIWILILTN